MGVQTLKQAQLSIIADPLVARQEQQIRTLLHNVLDLLAVGFFAAGVEDHRRIIRDPLIRGRVNLSSCGGKDGTGFSKAEEEELTMEDPSDWALHLSKTVCLPAGYCGQIIL